MSITESNEAATSKHTPGPWTVQEMSTRILILCRTGRGEEGQIACIDYGIDDVDRVNAHLIAAAPALLEALELILSRFDEAKSNYGFVSGADIRQASAAIALARGVPA